MATCGVPFWLLRAINVGVAAGLLTPSSGNGLQRSTWTVSARAVEMGKGADQLFESVRLGKLFADGSAVVADARGLFARVYRPDGAPRAAMGRRGAGPAEFQAISGLWLTPEGRIGVWDGRSRRLTTFDQDGRLHDSHQIRPEGKMAGNLELFLGSFRNGDVLLGGLQLRPPAPGEVVAERWILGRFRPGGEFSALAGEVRGMSRMYRAPLPFTPVPRIAVRADSVWVTEGYDAELKLLDPGGAVVRRIPLPWTVLPTRNPWSFLDAELRRLNKTMLVELLAETPRTDQFPVVGGLLVDDRALMWIKEYDPFTDALWLKGNALNVGAGGSWRVLDPNGTWVASVRMPDNVIPLDVRGDRLLAVALDDDDVEHVVVYTIQR